MQITQTQRDSGISVAQTKLKINPCNDWSISFCDWSVISVNPALIDQ